LLPQDACEPEGENAGRGRTGKEQVMHPDIEELIWITLKAFGAMLAIVYIMRIGRIGYHALNAL
jgi:hypothetical protein